MSAEMQVLVTLAFLASESLLQVIGDTVGLDKKKLFQVLFQKLFALIKKRHELIVNV